MDTSLPFILHLRCLCETVFDVMLSAYIAGLEAHYNQLKDKKGDSQRSNFDGCEKALRSAQLSQTMFRVAESQRGDGDVVSADLTVKKALVELQTRYYFHSSSRLIYPSLLCLSTGAVSTM